jgi:uncharacterized membrane protein
MTNEEKINLIGQKILILSSNLDKYQKELELLKQQLDLLQQGQTIKQQPIIVPPVVTTPASKIEIIPEVEIEKPIVKEEVVKQEPIVVQEQKHYEFKIPPQALKQKPKSDFNFEAFIGGKLIVIIGIIILVIGLGIGVKYAIDNDMLGPLARIALAYVAGGIILALALKLKTKYKAFSAVLVSGGMASLYFTTFIAYSMYENELGFHQLPAFIVMLIFTTFTVFAATVYDMEIIGIIGLVGAYAIPMLLSDGSGKIEVMLSYMLIVNCGILVLSFKKYWQVLQHVSYGFTWIIVAAWWLTKYSYETQTTLLLAFSFLFFIIFYISNMAYKVIKKEQFGVIDIIRIVSNSFIFFGIGYDALNHEATKDYLGMFTVANALVHLVFSYVVFKNKLLDRKLFYLLIALVLSFITIAVPVQLEGSWVTLFWSAEAVLLFSIGRYKAVRFYEWLGYIMIMLAVFSLWQDWGNTYYLPSYQYGGSNINIYTYWKPFANRSLVTSLFVIISMGSMIYVHHKKSITDEERKQFGIYNFAEYALPVLLFIIIYSTFSNEIYAYFETIYQQSVINVPPADQWSDKSILIPIWDENIKTVRDVFMGIYNIVFFSIFSMLAIRILKSDVVRWSAFAFNILCAIVFITVGLNFLGKVRNVYFAPGEINYFPASGWFLYLRYICFVLFAILLYLTHLLLKTETFKKFTISKMYTGCIIHFFILVILSNELLNIHLINSDTYHYYGTDAIYKLGFTALWGIYSFILIAWGIAKKNQILRISSISLFGITLIKLVVFDTWDLSTGYKVIAYMLLGVILLVVAFLYQKFKVLIFGDETIQE